MVIERSFLKQCTEMLPTYMQRQYVDFWCSMQHRSFWPVSAAVLQMYRIQNPASRDHREVVIASDID